MASRRISKSAMGSTEDLRVRALTLDDVEAACALNAEAGWNQVAADWRYMIAAGEGVAVEAPDGTVIASGMVLPSDGFAWIAMILVTKSWQRRGIATLVMRRCLEICDGLGAVAGLDATEQGRPVYLPLGFQDVYALSRFAADAVDVAAPPAGSVRVLRADDLAAVAAHDREVFGADRANVLAHLQERRPDIALLAERAGRPAGFVLGREGRLATQIGPVVADDEETASALLASALARVSGPVFLDLADRHARLREQVLAAGFQRQRGYVRMLVGRDAPIDDPARQFIITGPEFG